MAKRQRSPAYPAFDLPEAVEKARALYRAEATAPTSVSVAAEAWGFSPGSSSGPQAIATLKQYGLLDEEGRGQDRLVRISDLALDILEPQAEDQSEAAMGTAALNPLVFRELWDQFGGGGSDANLRAYLVRRGYNSLAIPGIIRAYRGTEKFAERGSRRKMILESSRQTPPDRPAEPERSSSSMAVSSPQSSISQSRDALNLPVLEGDGSVLMVSIPKMTAEAFTFLKKQLEVYQPAIVIPERAKPPAPPPETGGTASRDDDEPRWMLPAGES